MKSHLNRLNLFKAYLTILFSMLVLNVFCQDIEIERYFDKIFLEKDSGSLKEYFLGEDVDWEIISSNTYTINFGARGPEGSGRYWVLNLIKPDDKTGQGIIGAGILTSTRGYKTYLVPGLDWFEDVNSDGIDDFILWDTFEYYDDSISVGLMAWVYEYNENNTFVYSKDLTKIKGKLIIENYRKELINIPLREGQILQRTRNTLADALEKYLLELK